MLAGPVAVEAERTAAAHMSAAVVVRTEAARMWAAVVVRTEAARMWAAVAVAPLPVAEEAWLAPPAAAVPHMSGIQCKRAALLDRIEDRSR